MLKRILIVLSLISAYMPVSGQQIVKSFAEAVSDRCVNVSYSYKIISSTNIKGSGTLRLQDDAFYMNGDGLEIWCDGKTRWTLDRAAEEMAVESVSESESGAAAVDPALVLTSLDTHFNVVSSSSEADGLTKVRFSPLSGALEISSLTAWFKSAKLPVLSKADVVMEDGTVLEFVFTSMTYSEKVPVSEFSFDMKNASKSWIITDLR